MQGSTVQDSVHAPKMEKFFHGVRSPASERSESRSARIVVCIWRVPGASYPQWYLLSLSPPPNLRARTPAKSVLRATRNKAMIDLRHRTRIFVPEAVCLLGIVDETGLLEPGQARN